MARKSGNPLLTETTATPSEMAKFTQYALDVFNIQTPDLHDAKQVESAIRAYFLRCEQAQIRPGNLGLYASLGMSKQDVNNVITGKSKSKASLESIDLIKKAQRAMSAFRESLAMEGKINPVSYIFMGKNFDHLSDVQQVELTAKQAQEASLSPDEIQKQLEQDIPIDIE